MSVLDPIPDPQGGYLGVYHTAFRLSGDPFEDFRISLGYSTDLIHWTRLEILDPAGASMPTLRAIAGSPGFLLAYEKQTAHRGNSSGSASTPRSPALLAGQFSAQRDLPRLFSPYNNGTPTILWAQWHGSLPRSAIELGFHYESAPKGWRGPDREALGILRGFRTWTARTDPAADAALDRQGPCRQPRRLAAVRVRRPALARLRGANELQRLRLLAGRAREPVLGRNVLAGTEDGLADRRQLVRQSGRVAWSRGRAARAWCWW